MGDKMDLNFLIPMVVVLYIVLGILNGARCMSWSNGYINPKDVLFWPLNL